MDSLLTINNATCPSPGGETEFHKEAKPQGKYAKFWGETLKPSGLYSRVFSLCDSYIILQH